MIAEMQTKKTGRPPKREGERLSKNRTFRVRGGLDEKLQSAARASGRSVSEEIEFRLERSFLEDRSREQTLDLIMALDAAAKARARDAEYAAS